MPRELRVLPRNVPVERPPAEDRFSGSVPVEVADVPEGQSVAAPTTILLIGHGSRDPEGADQHREVAALLDARFGPARPVVPCFLELADPSILDAIDACARAGTWEIVALPFMLFAANHVKSDVPAAIIAARARHPDVAIRYGAPLDAQPEMLAALDGRIAAVERLDPSFGCAEAAVGRAETAILLVERGSSDPDANARVYQLARLLWEGRGFGWVEPCFIGITRPTLDEGMARCVALGARRVIVAPYFLFTGVLVRRIARMVGDLRAVYPRVRIEVAEHLGAHPSILDLAAWRIEEASAGEVRMSCDRCKWRVPLVGFEQRVGQPQTSDRAHGLREGGTMGHDHRHDHALGGASGHEHLHTHDQSRVHNRP